MAVVVDAWVALLQWVPESLALEVPRLQLAAGPLALEVALLQLVPEPLALEVARPQLAPEPLALEVALLQLAHCRCHRRCRNQPKPKVIYRPDPLRSALDWTQLLEPHF